MRFIKGLLTGPPAQALQLDDFAEELYSDDQSGTPIEDLVPDYSILSQIDYQYPVRDAYFAYTSRGCIRKCQFCGVPKLEGMQRDVESLTAIVRAIDDMYGPKKDLILMDNNVVASPRFKDIIAEIRDLGFTPGAKLTRPGARVPVQRRVDFKPGRRRADPLQGPDVPARAVEHLPQAAQDRLRPPRRPQTPTSRRSATPTSSASPSCRTTCSTTSTTTPPTSFSACA